MNDTAIQDPAFRVLRTMLRVSDMDRSVDFYTRLLGMRALEQRQHKKNRFTQTYLGYCEADDGAALELVFNWSGDEPIVLGSAFGRIAIGVYGITALCAKLAKEGVKMPRPPSTRRHGENFIAFIEDPDGYRIELMEQKRPEKNPLEKETELADA